MNIETTGLKDVD